jgi:hypothetical protein
MIKMIIPVKDKFKHLNISLPVNKNLIDFYSKRIGEDVEISVIQQSNKKKWNIGKVVNTGFDIVNCKDDDYFCWLPADHIIDPTVFNDLQDLVYAFWYKSEYKNKESLQEIVGGMLANKYMTGYSMLIFQASIFRKIGGMSHDLPGWGCDDAVITNKVINKIDTSKCVIAEAGFHFLDWSLEQYDIHDKRDYSNNQMNRIKAEKTMKGNKKLICFCDNCLSKLNEEEKRFAKSDFTPKDLINDNKYKIKSESNHKDFDDIKWYKVDW